MKYNGDFYIDKKLATGRFGKYRASLKQCTCPEFESNKLPCTYVSNSVLF